MHRNHTSATVVPSASDEQNVNDKPLSSDASRVNGAAGRRHSALAAPATPLESSLSLHAALNGGGDATPPSQPQTPPVPTRQRSQSVASQKEAAAALTKNYPELVKGFKQLQPYTRHPDGSYPSHTRCIYCANAGPTSVFFPCQHMCVCDDCIKAAKLSPDAQPSCLCPICMTDIRLILPHTGKEEEKYWKWVMEVKPSMPSHFKQEFKEAGKNLRKNSIASTEPAPRRSTIIGSFIHKISSPATDAENGSLPSGRRHSWHPGVWATTYNAAASKEQEETHNCVIL
ncbi:hypothetical protein BBJ28_00012530 [Nothophytophthora sp. Chile5]|nr:hypothetical protein BBJ28_00012530 [Nothophytophthora sp. Chile5]